MSSLARNSAARMVVEVGGVGLGAVAAIVTARWLGPSGKGIVATLTLTAMLVGRLATMGLGESGIVMVGKGISDQEHVLRANIGAVLLSGIVGTVICWSLAAVIIQPGSEEIWLAVAVAAVTVPISAAQDIVSHGLTMQERIVQSSSVVGATALSTVSALVGFVVVLDLGVLGAALGSFVGVAVGVTLAAVMLSRDFSLRPRLDREYLRPAIRYGLKLEVSYLITLMAARLDLLLVFVLAGSGDAGNYSVALTVAGLVALAPFSFTYAAFPRLAYLGEAQSRNLALVIWRRGLLASVAMAAVVGATVPLLLPFAFGSDFEPAVLPTLILLLGAVCVAGQWMLARALAARGNPKLLMQTYALSLAVMVPLDLLMIPLFGMVGAAVASTVSSMAGLALCIVRYLRQGTGPSDMTPGREDLAALLRSFRTLVGDLVHRRWRVTPPPGVEPEPPPPAMESADPMH